MPLANLIAYAYGIESFQVTGPERRTSDRFDIEAKFSEGADSKNDRSMLQSLLRDRFKLAFHIEKRELEIYALVVGKHGAKLKPSLPNPGNSEAGAPLTSGDSNARDGLAKPEITKNTDGSSTFNMGKRGTQTTKFDRESWSQHWELSQMTMEELALRLSVCIDISYHKVVDETGI